MKILVETVLLVSSPRKTEISPFKLPLRISINRALVAQSGP